MINQLQIRGLSLTYGSRYRALDQVTLDISSGMFGLLGPNGPGKSSLLNSIAGLIIPQQGEIIFNGIDIIRQPEFIKKQLGFLPQDFGVYPKVTAYELLNHLAILKGVTEIKARNNQILNLLEQVNLSNDKDKQVATFSGGMRQRFGIAQALLGNPQIIIVDEPTAGLDPEERQRFYFLLNEIAAEVIVILSTHLVEDVQQLCTQLAIINQGKILIHGSPEALILPLQGYLWTKILDKNEAARIKKDFQIISIVAAQNQKVEITVHANHPPPGYYAVQPTLEHVYFYYITTLNSPTHVDHIPV